MIIITSRNTSGSDKMDGSAAPKPDVSCFTVIRFKQTSAQRSLSDECRAPTCRHEYALAISLTHSALTTSLASDEALHTASVSTFFWIKPYRSS